MEYKKWNKYSPPIVESMIGVFLRKVQIERSAEAVTWIFNFILILSQKVAVVFYF
jgi:hypothetical protein